MKTLPLRKLITVSTLFSLLSFTDTAKSFGNTREGWSGPVEESYTTIHKFERSGKDYRPRAEFEVTLKSNTYNVYRRVVNKLVDIAYTESVQVESNGVGGNWQDSFDHASIERAVADKSLVKDHYYCPDVMSIHEKADCFSRTFRGITYQQAKEMLEAGFLKNRVEQWHEIILAFNTFDDENRFSRNFLNKYGNENLAVFDSLNRSIPVRIAPENEFYCPNVLNSAGIDDKADCLTKLFKGINFQQAYGMLQAGSLRFRTDDWNEFTLAILEFDQAYPHAGLANKAITIHGNANLKILDDVALSIRQRSKNPPEDYYCANAISLNDKANCLSRKFRGFAHQRALAMLHAGYLNKRTTSWNEFTADIIEYEQKNPISALAYSVTALNGVSNAITLQSLNQQYSDAKKEVLKKAFLDERANRLTRAITGLSFQQAHGMAELGYLTTQPTSWRDFSNEIERFSQTRPEAGIARTILDLYGSQNKRNLKFEITQNNIKYRKEPRDIEERDQVLKCTNERKFKFILLNSLLDLHGKEWFTVSLTGEIPSVSIFSNYNSYNEATPTVVDGSPVTFEYVVNATPKRFSPANSLQAQVKEEDGYLQLAVTDKNFDEERAGFTEVFGKVIETGRFGKTKEIGSFSAMLNPEEKNTLVKTNIRFSHKKSPRRWFHVHRYFGLWDWWHEKSVHVIYRMKRRGNPMYTDDNSNEQTTDSVTL